MTFSSPIFLFIFFPFFIFCYYLIRPSFRNGLITIASLVFYFWGEPRFVVIMVLSVLLNYLTGLFADNKYPLYVRRISVVFCIVANLGLLFVFKYLGFFTEIVNQITQLQLKIPQIALPIGISFFTFQGMSYVLDVYHEKVYSQKKLSTVMLYIAMFPQLIAGPIVRYRDIVGQIENREVNFEKLRSGIIRFTVGLSKKMILANSMGIVVDQIFAIDPGGLPILVTWFGAVAYAMQIFFDFSGYSDMAIGLGKMLGFEFMENFKYPYTANNIKDFWRRWHISLSEWFRDYLYFPMGGSRKGNIYFHLAVVFLATGIWHGATWNFVLWGMWHGTFRIFEQWIERKGHNISGILGWLYTIFVVLIGWVLFRADNLTYAWRYLQRMFGFLSSGFIPYSVNWFLSVKTVLGITACVFVAVIFGLKPMMKIREHWNESLVFGALKTIGLIVILFYSIALVMTSSYNPFIYFRFKEFGYE